MRVELSERDADLLLARARRGDRDAFGHLAEAHRRGLQLHCYQMTGSLRDAEDVPPRQRAVLLLREVLGWPAAEVAASLQTSVASVHSLLQRARRALEARRPRQRWQDGSPNQLAEAERALLARFVRAWESADLDSLARLLREDAVMSMPPQPEWYAGRAAAIAFLAAIPFGPEGLAPFRALPTRANGQPAYGLYPRAPDGAGYQAMALAVLTIQEGLIGQITGFVDPALLPRFGLPERVEA